MAKSVVLSEAEYLELVHQVAYWKAQFERRRERDCDLETRLKDANAENRQLKAQLAAGRQEHSQVTAALKGKIVETADELEKLTAQLETQRKMIFGSRSEQKKDDESSKESTQTGAGPKTPTRKRGKQKGSKGKGRQRRENLKEEERILDLGDDEKDCSKCGLPYCRSKKTEDSWVYEWRVQIVRVKVVRSRYIRKCDCKSSPKFKVAPKMAKPIPKGMFAANLLAKLLIYHFNLQFPLNRIIAMMKMEGLVVSQGTLTGVLKKLQPLFRPLYQEILRKAQAGNHWHMDETTWRMLCSPTKKRWWLWVVSTPKCVCFILDPSRSAKIPKAFFGDEAEGILSVDRYGAYKGLGAKIHLAFCWAHVRRDFLKVEGYAKLKNWAIGWLKRIGKLYQLNRERLRAEANAKIEKAEKALKKQVEAIE
jgi:transposase